MAVKLLRVAVAEVRVRCWGGRDLVRLVVCDLPLDPAEAAEALDRAGDDDANDMAAALRRAAEMPPAAADPDGFRHWVLPHGPGTFDGGVVSITRREWANGLPDLVEDDPDPMFEAGR